MNRMSPAVSISDTEIWEKNKRFIVYKLVVNCGSQSWCLFRRYNEFHALYDKLKKLYPRAQLKLPGKRLFGNFEPLFIRQRRDGLCDFVQKLLGHPEMQLHADVRAFFHLDCGSEEEDDALDSPGQRDGDDVTNLVNLGPSEEPRAKPGDFEFLKMIGKGSFGKVLLARHKMEGRLYAVKVLNKSHILRKNETKHIMSERNVLVTNIKHSFLVGMHYSFQTPNKLYFVLDYINGGELFYHLQHDRYFSEVRARFYAAEIASALGYLHSKNIIYRDLKPENILLDSQGHIVLTDFGLCKEGIKGRDTTSTFCGTPEYLAPEVLLKQPYDKTVDWWCLGSVLYEMLFGLPPFYARDLNEMYDKILHHTLQFRGKSSSPAVRDILEKLLQKEKDKRLGSKGDFAEISSHSFFSGINWTQLMDKRIKPPYNPNVSGQLDLRHFDPAFVQEPVPASVGRSGGETGASVKCPEHAFDGFSYVMPAHSKLCVSPT
ncbi:hypothetical protein NP493_2g08007 [Ridgeia piscesae]|uniref:Uncharacterized protein n=1 Tax=Ridgeia piscesae TaxID=27915 RepID=A0AAD9PG04_RIDPI|nr:hypothetical protein NP493_2g08007 [Ridgeia piscesae]